MCFRHYALFYPCSTFSFSLLFFYIRPAVCHKDKSDCSHTQSGCIVSSTRDDHFNLSETTSCETNPISTNFNNQTSPPPLLLFSSCAIDLSNRMKRRGLNKLGNRVENAGGTLGSQNIRKYLSMLYAGGEPNICVPRLSM